MYSLALLQQHLEKHWGNNPSKLKWPYNPHRRLHNQFSILEFPPNEQHNCWIYSTLGMPIDSEEHIIELHLRSSKQDNSLVELLTVTASFHRSNTELGLHHSVNFGRPWQDNSPCSYGFISLPYLDGEELEIFDFENRHLHNLWFIPITENEKDYKMQYGWDALEDKFEACELDYINPHRASCV